MNEFYKNMKQFFDEKSNNWDINLNEDKKKKIQTILDITKTKNDKKILDIGCGTGVLEEFFLKDKDCYVFALDISKKMIEKAKDKYKDFNNVSFLEINLYDFMEKDFDLVYIYNVYPHIIEKEKFLNKLVYFLKENKRFVIAHSSSKKEINNIHKNIKSKISNNLLNAFDEMRFFQEYFNIDIVIDSDEFYIISGTKKEI